MQQKQLESHCGKHPSIICVHVCVCVCVLIQFMVCCLLYTALY